MSNLFSFLLIVQAIVGAVMIGVILMQKSEGGGLGMGGSPSGLLSARGAADFMTRATAILAMLFVGLSIILAAMASSGTSGTTIDTSLSKSATPGTPLTGAAVPAPTAAPTQAQPVSDDPLAAAAAAAATAAPKGAAEKGVPLEQ